MCASSWFSDGAKSFVSGSPGMSLTPRVRSSSDLFEYMAKMCGGSTSVFS